MKTFPTHYLFWLFMVFFGCNIGSENNHDEQFIVSVGNNKEPLPDELQPFIPEGHVPMLLERGDFNKDGLSDYFIALQILLPANLGEEKTRELNRRLSSPSLVILRQKDNTLILHTKNERAILQGYALGINGKDLRIAADSLGGGFTISYITRDTETQGLYSVDDYHFTYDNTTDSFYLNNVKEEFGVLKPELHPELMATTAKEYKPKVGKFDIELGTIPFNSFDFIKYLEAGGPHQKKTQP
ncbi:hypothetical protein [Pontibacter liquoris]|uniref:hypothetical protein n=1 Tax=Pontibacter liquoris TaxID=2905677 RepID=UPI001FA7EA2C|nr:hypothetical protein [Pontibacter liquoris]